MFRGTCPANGCQERLAVSNHVANGRTPTPWLYKWGFFYRRGSDGPELWKRCPRRHETRLMDGLQ